MAKADSFIVRIGAKIEGFESLKKLDGTFNKLNKSLKLTPLELKETIKSITKYDKRSERSVNTFNKQIAALKALQNQTSPKEISTIRNKKISEVVEKRG